MEAYRQKYKHGYLKVINMKIGNRSFDKGTYIMGILNVTPDSFSDGGRYNSSDAALRHAERLVSDGADIIDVGGESTRPGYTQISDGEEIERVAPVIERLKRELDIPVSVDTYKYKVARASVEAGADMINDIWGVRYDNGEMAELIAKSGLPCCLMHNRTNENYTSFLDDVISDLSQSVKTAENAGIDKNKIILDPGIGFAKSYQQNLQLINNLERLHSLGYPLLLGASRKSVIGLTLNLPSSERLEGTLVTTVMAVMKGCRFVRVHDALENKRAVIMAEAILNSKEDK